MELNDKYEKGFWTKDNNSGRNIFIINDGLIEKLCILGSDVEPCFEGSQIKSFSLTSPEFAEFKATMFSMINELKDALSKGGSEEMENENKNPQTQEETTPVSEFEKKKPDEENDKKKETEQQQDKNSDTSTDDKKENKEDTSDDKKDKKKYELNEIAEYVALQLQYSELQGKYSDLEKSYQALSEEVEGLRQFKLTANRKEKEAMVASFYMLSDEDKKDVVDHMDTYSLDDIEAKLSILCVRNKVDFSLDKKQEDKPDATKQYMLNLQQNENNDTDDAPAWVKAVRQKSN